MAQGIVHTTVSFTTHSRLVRDQVQAGFTFTSGSLDVNAIAAGMLPLLTSFYTLPHSETTPVALTAAPLMNFMGQSIDETVPAVVRSYALSRTSSTTPDAHAPGTGFGSPIAVAAIDISAMARLAGPNVPEQCCVVLSYSGLTTGLAEHSGPGPRPAARHRGRIYFGPLNTAALVNDPTTKAARVSGALLDSLRLATQKALFFTGEAQFCVWSRKNNAVEPAFRGFVDNRIDTQRRRAEAATFRSTFSGTGG